MQKEIMQDPEENPEDPETGDGSSFDNDAANGDYDNDDHECKEDNVGHDNDISEDRPHDDNDDMKSENDNNAEQDDRLNLNHDSGADGSDTEIETKPDIDPSIFDDGSTQNTMDQGEEDIKSEVGSTCKDEEEEEGDGVKLEIKEEVMDDLDDEIFEKPREMDSEEEMDMLYEMTPFPCSQCSFIAYHINILRYHEKREHGLKHYFCKHCQFSGDGLPEMRAHYRALHMEKVYKHKCEECNYACSNAKDLTKHKLKKHSGTVYPCDQCTFKAVTNGMLLRHKKSCLKVKDFYQCKQCDFKAVTKSKVSYHRKTIHRHAVFPCDLCEVVLKTRQHLKRHKESIHEGVKYLCDQCTFAASSPYNLKQHREAIHEGKRYPCDVCEFAATQKGSLKVHKQRIHGIEPIRMIRGSNNHPNAVVPTISPMLSSIVQEFKTETPGPPTLPDQESPDRSEATENLQPNVNSENLPEDLSNCSVKKQQAPVQQSYASPEIPAATLQQHNNPEFQENFRNRLPEYFREYVPENFRNFFPENLRGSSSSYLPEHFRSSLPDVSHQNFSRQFHANFMPENYNRHQSEQESYQRGMMQGDYSQSIHQSNPTLQDFNETLRGLIRNQDA